MIYYCSSCQKHFTSEIEDNAAQKELQQTFPGVRPEDCLIVCDDCYYQEVPRA